MLYTRLFNSDMGTSSGRKSPRLNTMNRATIIYINDKMTSKKIIEWHIFRVYKPNTNKCAIYFKIITQKNHLQIISTSLYRQGYYAGKPQ